MVTRLGLVLIFVLISFPVVGQTPDYPMPKEDYSLGALYNKAERSVEFRLWAPTAKTVTVSLFDQASAPFSTALGTINLSKNESTGVWTGIFKDKDPAGMYYEYRLDTGKGIKRVLDPYALSMEGFKGKGFARAVIVDPEASEPQGGWQGAEDIKLPQRTDSVIYEMSVRDFTISPDSGVPENLRGTYLGFIQKIPYLKSLGITHVQLMPVQNFMYNDETNKAYDSSGKTVGSNYNWGYGPQNYFTPEGWYSSDPMDPLARIKELKTLVRELHKAGIGVVLDVVYNHLGTTTLLDDILPDYWFRRTGAGKLTNDSYVGNDLNTSAPMVRRLIGDSLEYWSREFKVDGYRFDLMGLMDAQTVLAGSDRVRKIPGKEDSLFLGEGWRTYRQKPLDGGMMDQNYMTKTDVVAVFNDDLRNLLKGDANNPSPGFLTGKAVDKTRLFHNLIGLLDAKKGEGYTTDNPGDNIQHLAVHDGMTLHDSLAYTLFTQQSLPVDEAEVAQRARLGYFLLLTAQGIPFIHGGDEILRSKPNPTGSTSQAHGPFVHNSYQASDGVNQVLWTLDGLKTTTLEYVKGLLAFRKAFPIFRLPLGEKVLAAAKVIPQTSPLGFSYSLKDEKGTWYILANGSKEAAVFNLPGDMTGAQVYVDQSQAGVKPLGMKSSIKGTNVEVPGLSGLILFK